MQSKPMLGVLVVSILAPSCQALTGINDLEVVTGSSLSFDGMDDYVNVPNSTSLNLGNEFSIEAWVKLAKLPSERALEGDPQGMKILGKGSTPGDANNRGYHLWVYNGSSSNHLDKVVFSVWDAAALGSTAMSSPLAKNEWYHVVGVHSASFHGLYVNGALVEALTGPVVLANDSWSLAIGSHLGYASFLDGKITGVKIYSRALSADEVEAHFAGHFTGNTAVAVWNFSEDTGQTVGDASGNANDGTLGESLSDEASDPSWSDDAPAQWMGGRVSPSNR